MRTKGGMMFTENEIAYIQSQRLARLATDNGDGQPDAVPVGFEFDGTIFFVGGRYLPSTRKFKNVQAGRTKIALVIDDLISVDPWRPRSIRIYGTAESVEREGRFGPGSYLKITPNVSWSWAIDNASAYGAPQKTIHTIPA